ncbi:dynamin family protein [Acidipila sp. EB88]|uniref:dynamin family protein n=1 Tax=Acidipila sp. EB88 TaxID=2305226 RepID=UPI0013152520|nr:dynamin family protein [Acidipila sp. EB88]
MKQSGALQSLAENASRAQVIARSLGALSEVGELNEWAEDLKDPFKVVVLGEFNRGKTSVLNALFGIRTLPVGVLPTTSVITVLRYAREPYVRVFYNEGSPEELPWSKDAMEQYIGSEADLSRISFVDVGYPHPLLETGAVFVDTPGVSDLNKQRVEVTYHYVPRADAVLFLLDSTTPVTQSEMDFLQTTVMQADVSRLLFLANFIDLLEVEERGDAVRLAGRRIRESVGENCDVIAISAKEAQSGGSDEGTGFASLERWLLETINRSQHSEERVDRFRSRLLSIVNRLRGIVEDRLRLSTLKQDQLQLEVSRLSHVFEERLKKVQRLAIWLRDREEELLAMTAKSMDCLRETMEEEILDQLQNYGGRDFRQAVGQVPLTVKRRLKMWVDSRTPVLQKLFHQVNCGLTDALGREFHTEVPLLRLGAVSIDKQAGAIEMTVPPEFASAQIKAGAIAGLAMVAAQAVGFAMFPLIGLVGLPFLQDKLLKGSTERDKQTLIPGVRAALCASHDAFRSSVLDSIRVQFQALGAAAEEQYRRLAEAEVHAARGEIVARSVLDDQWTSFQQPKYAEILDELQGIISRVQGAEGAVSHEFRI